MFETIAAGVLVPVAVIGLLVVLALRFVLRAAGRDRHRRDDPADPLQQWIRTSAILGGFGPFWYSAGISPRPHPQTDEER